MVFEGLKEVKKDIQEDEPTNPVLSYSNSKAINENQLKILEKIMLFLDLALFMGILLTLRV